MVNISMLKYNFLLSLTVGMFVSFLLSNNSYADDTDATKGDEGIKVVGQSDSVIGAYIDGLCKLQDTYGVSVLENYTTNNIGDKVLLKTEISHFSTSFFSLECKAVEMTYCGDLTENECREQGSLSFIESERTFKTNTKNCSREISTGTGINPRSHVITFSLLYYEDIYNSKHKRCENNYIINHFWYSGINIVNTHLNAQGGRYPLVYLTVDMQKTHNPWVSHQE